MPKSIQMEVRNLTEKRKKEFYSFPVVKCSACGYRDNDNFRTSILFLRRKLGLMPGYEGVTQNI